MRYQVPQFVDIQDKVIGPFTLKQFLIYFSAVLLLIPVYLLSDLSLFITLAVPLGGLAALFAHFKPNGKPLSVFVTNALNFFTKGQVYLWQRLPNQTPLKVRGEEIEDMMLEDEIAAYEMSSLDRAMQSLETKGNVSQVDEEDPLSVEAASKETPPTTSKAKPAEQTK